MNYPISASDLADIEVDDDEQATLVVIEAISNGTFNELLFKEPNTADDLKSKIEAWDRYCEYKDLIDAEKALFKGSIATGLGQEVTDPTIAAQAAINATRAIQPNKQGRKPLVAWTNLGIAASILIIVLGVGAVINSSLNTSSGQKSSSEAVLNLEENANESDLKTSSDQQDQGSSPDETSEQNDRDYAGGLNDDTELKDANKSSSTQLITMAIVFALMIGFLLAAVFILRKAAKNSND